MPPHCDSMDGPVVLAAQRALEQGDVSVILPYVHEEGEAEVAEAFEHAVRTRGMAPEVREVVDRYFFETAVRVHRAGEGAPYTGLKPAGLGFGPVIPVAERALVSGSPDELATLLAGTVEREVCTRLAHATALASHASEGVAQAREYVEAMLGLQVWAHGLYQAATGSAHAEPGEGGKPEGHQH